MSPQRVQTVTGDRRGNIETNEHIQREKRKHCDNENSAFSIQIPVTSATLLKTLFYYSGHCECSFIVAESEIACCVGYGGFELCFYFTYSTHVILIQPLSFLFQSYIA